jgi:DNA (cytosine-5)-methyltransferase 3A
MRLLNETKPKYFLLENVMMGEKWEKVLSKAIGVKPIMINSALKSAQNRQRLYWTNIGLKPSGLFGDLESTIQQPKDKGILLKDILQDNVDSKYNLTEKALKLLGRDLINKSISNQKSMTIDASYYKGVGIRSNECRQIVHNTMPRSSKTGKGGSGPLSRIDGKTYCLDTGTTNAIEIIKCARMVGRNPENPKSRKPCNNTEQFIEKRFDDKSGTLTTVQKDNLLTINSLIRRLTPIECERLQTVDDNYTNHVSDSQRYKMLGNGWTVDVIVHILNYMKDEKN